jgi:tetratricopeptide (TPR) repeat protein
MLESIRSFAADRLSEAERTEDVSDRALAWAAALCAEAAASLEGAERVVWMQRLAQELDNLRAVIVDAIDRRPADALRVVTSIGDFWAVRGHWAEARGYLDACLSAEGPTNAERADALSLGGRLSFLEADYDEARRQSGEALRLRKQLGDTLGEARVLADLGRIAEARTDFASARDLFGESLSLHRSVSDERGAAEQLSNLGSVAEYTSDYEVAHALHQESLAIRRRIDDKHGIATTLLNLGYVMNYRGDPAGKQVLEEAASAFTEVGDRYGASRAMNLLAIRAWFEGDPERAWTLGQEAMRMRYEVGDRLGIAVSFESIGGLAAFQGHGAYAGTMFGAAERLRDALASPITPSDAALLQWAHNDAKKAVGDDAFEQARATGRAMRIEDAVALSLTRPTSHV